MRILGRSIVSISKKAGKIKYDKEWRRCVSMGKGKRKAVK
jgi:hypothetical protein